MLPAFSTLLVDEAHLLAGVAEQAFSTQIAFRTLIASLHDEPTWRSVRALSAARHAGRGSKRSWRAFSTTRPRGCKARTMSSPRSCWTICAPVWWPWRRPWSRWLAERKVRTATTRTVEDTLALVRGLLKRELAATVTFSPARRFPSITAGPRSLWWFFDALWERVARVALVSATLYLPREMADESYGLIKTVLHLPADRIGTFSPITDRSMPSPCMCRGLRTVER